MSDVELIKSKLDVVDFVGKYIPLKKAGANYKGICPFHQEKTPSFMVSPEKQIWHCFGCGRGGDAIKFLMEKEGVEFLEALKILADQTGVQLSKIPSQGMESRKRLYAMNELATKYFQKSLEDSVEGRKAKDYLINRGMKPETITEFRLGFAPTSGKAMLEFLKRREYKEDEIERMGLAVKKGYLKDKFVNRIIFPLTDALGRVVGFSGRVMTKDGVPKYLNSPETPIFHKSDILYALDLAKDVARKEQKLVLVEGQMDVISSHQAGIKNVVGVSGTALTSQQMKLISRYVPEIILALDADEAGSEATKRAVTVAGEFDVSVKVALFGEYKDPDALIQAGASRWQKSLDEAVPVMDFYFDSVIKRFDIRELEDKKQITKEILSVIHKLVDPVEKDFYIKKLGRLIDVEPKILYDALSKTSSLKKRFVTPKTKEEMPPEMIEDRVIAMSQVYPQFAGKVAKDGEKIKWASTLAKSVYDNLQTWYNARSDFESNKFLQQLSANDRTSLLELMLVVEENYKEVAEENIETELTFYLDLLKKRSYASRRGELVSEIEQAEKSQNKEKLDELLVELKDL